MNGKQVDLETRIAYLERTLEALDEVVVRQQGQIDRLGERISSMTDLLRQASREAAGETGSDPD